MTRYLDVNNVTVFWGRINALRRYFTHKKKKETMWVDQELTTLNYAVVYSGSYFARKHSAYWETATLLQSESTTNCRYNMHATDGTASTHHFGIQMCHFLKWVNTRLFCSGMEVVWLWHHELTFIMSCLTNNNRKARKERISFWFGLGPSENSKQWLLNVANKWATEKDPEG